MRDLASRPFNFELLLNSLKHFTTICVFLYKNILQASLKSLEWTVSETNPVEANTIGNVRRYGGIPFRTESKKTNESKNDTIKS